MGGAMDLVSGARRVIALMEHRTRTGEPKLVDTCTLRLAGRRVLDIADGTFTLVELAPGITAVDVQDATAAPVA